jgi:hypothetical protein
MLVLDEVDADIGVEIGMKALSGRVEASSFLGVHRRNSEAR